MGKNRKSQNDHKICNVTVTILQGGRNESLEKQSQAFLSSCYPLDYQRTRHSNYVITITSHVHNALTVVV